MSTPVIESPTATYLAAVGAALADLPAADRADLLDDVAQHLAEVAAETDASLSSTLGSPAAYAADLRAAAGLPEPIPGSARVGAPTAFSRLASHRATKATTAFVRSLRPAWWVLRGILVGGALVLPWHRSTVLIRPRASSVAELTVAVVLCVAVSVGLGRGLPRLARPWRVIGVAVNIAAVVGALLVFTDLQHRLSDEVRRAAYPAAQPVYVTQNTPTPASLADPSGLIYNIYPFDAQGRPLTGVQLLDQDGRPINVEVGQSPNGVPLTRQVPVGADGQALDNVFPQTQAVPGGTPAPTPSAPAAIANGPLAVVPPGPGSPQPVILGTAGPVAATPAVPAAASAPATSAVPVASAAPGASATPVASAAPDASAVPVK